MSKRGSWWPPKVGDRLRGFVGPSSAPEDPLIHVVSVFEHNGETLVVGADWWPPKQRWLYEVHSRHRADVGLIRPDGTPRRSDDE